LVSTTSNWDASDLYVLNLILSRSVSVSIFTNPWKGIWLFSLNAP
jgi:hypothetical protein